MLGVFVRLNSNVKVSTRVLGGFTIVLLLVVALGGMAITSLIGVRNEFTQYSTTSQNALTAQKIQTDFHMMRRNELSYVASGADTARDQAIAAEHNMEKLFAEMQPRLIIEANRRLAEDAKTRAGEYLQNFQRVVAQTEAATKLRTERTDGVGQRILEELDAVEQSALARQQHGLAEAVAKLQTRIMQVRLESARIQLRPDAALVERIGAIGRRIEADFSPALAVATAAADQAALRKAQTDTQAYVTALVELGRIMTDRDRLAGEVSYGIARRLDETLNQLSTNQYQANERIRNEMGSDIENTLRATLITAGAAVVLGGLLAWLIGRGIAGPVTRMTGAMTELAAGRLETEIPARDNRDEIGAMAKAVQVFKDNAIAVRRMEEEAKAAAIAAEAEKKAAMRKLADDFQEAVGGVVHGVASAATQMQGSAQTFPPPRNKPAARPAPSVRRPRKPAPTCRPWPRHPRNWPPASPRSAARW